MSFLQRSAKAFARNLAKSLFQEGSFGFESAGRPNSKTEILYRF